MGYVVARRPMLMQSGELRPVGKPVPEAAEWPRTALWANLQTGFLKEIPDAEMPKRLGRPPKAREGADTASVPSGRFVDEDDAEDDE